MLRMSRFLITGGSQGIGAALVSHARHAGHDVVFTGRNGDAVNEMSNAHGAHGIKADVAIDADNARVVDFCMTKMGGVDVLINNAGVGYIADVGAIEMERMRELFGINVFGMVDVTNRIVPGMIKQGSGDIINIASTSGTKGAKGYTAYAGSKWAVRGITQCWQAELRPHGIRVMCLLPSEVQTNWMGRTGRNNPNKLYARNIAETIFAALEMPRNVLWPEVPVFANNPWREDCSIC
jgi:3-oxoacyl-[acyl-carrier protein] reductase